MQNNKITITMILCLSIIVGSISRHYCANSNIILLLLFLVIGVLVVIQPIAGIFSTVVFNIVLPKAGFYTNYFTFHINWADILFVLTVIAVLVRYFNYKENLVKNKKYVYMILLLTIWGIISAIRGLFNSAAKSNVIDEFLRQFAYPFISLLVLIIIEDKKTTKQLIIIFISSVFVSAVYGIMQRLGGEKFVEIGSKILLILGYPEKATFMFDAPELKNRITSTFLSFNALGQYLTAVNLLILSCVIYKNNINLASKILLSIISAILFFAIGLTRSRSSWVGMFVGLVVLGILLLRKRFWLIPLLFMIVLLVIIPFEHSVLVRIQSFTNISTDGTAQGRLTAIREALQFIRSSPFLGYGLGMITGRYLPAKVVFYEGLDCYYIKYWIANGLIGLILFLLPFTWLLKKSFKIIFSKNEVNIDWYLSGIICGLISLLVGALFDSTLAVSTYMAALLWFYLGLGFGRIKYYQE